uniref:LysR family transcriptional regulator n=1 Tax=Pararhizobium sp. IMCC3301 TaxID=3067904 RepID=UPI0027424A38|nr:LysR family transcriptional regulator [Pararhizobium sp. IMCC3301]
MANISDRYLILVKRFVTVAEVGSIQRAAVELGLSQPSLTQSIKRIEEIFECKLFERTKRGVILTLTGEKLFHRSKSILKYSNLAQEEISDIVDGRTGSLKLSGGTAWGTCFLPSIIRDLQQKYPELKVELDITLTHLGRERLYRGELDLFVGAIFGKLNSPEGFTHQLLCKQHYALGCGPGSPLANAKSVSFRDLAKLPVVIYHDDELLMSNVINRIESDHQVRLNVAVQTKSLLAALQIVREGPYIFFMAETFLQQYSSLGIQTVKLQEPLYEFDTAMFYRESLRQTEPFKHLLAALRQFQQ